MTETRAPSPKPWASWSRRRWVVTVAVAVAVIALVVGSIVGLSIARANAEAAAAAAAQAEAEEREAEEREAAALASQEAARAQAATTAEEALEEGEVRYTESEAYGVPEDREALRTALDELAELLDDDEATTNEIRTASRSVRTAIQIVGTAQDAEARRQAEADAALDKQYEDRAAQLEGNGMIPPYNGREYCEYLHEFYTPEDVYPALWGDSVEARQIDVAAVEVYCPEFAAVMNQVVAGFYDGNHVVGRDFPGGTYRTWGAVSNCYWERNDGSGNIIENNFVTSAHNGVSVTVRDGEGFSTQGCGLWIPG